MKSVLVLMGGIINRIDDAWWEKFFTKAGLKISFAFSTWYDYPLAVGESILSRTILRDQEHQYAVEESYKDIAEKLICVVPESIPMNTLKMWHKWDRYNHLLKLTDYDVIVKTRADIEVGLEFVQTLINVIHEVQNARATGLAVPSGGDWRYGINDVIAVGRPDCISYYLSIIRNVCDYYAKTRFFHAEWMLRYHLFDAGRLKVKRFPFPINIRGRLYNGECQRTYTDNYPLSAGFLREFYEEKKRSDFYSALRQVRHYENHHNPKTKLRCMGIQ